MKKKKYLLILSLVLSSIICLGAVSVIFAWIVNADIMRKMEFQILQIDSTINFYRAKDENYNGVPDLLKTNGHDPGTYEDKDEDTTENKTEKEYKAYPTQYYTEKYDFKLIDNKYMLSADTEANTFTDIRIDDAAPSRVYTFKAEIINYSGLAVTLECAYDAYSDERKKEIKDADSSVEYLNQLETRIGTVDKYGVVTFDTWKPFTPNGEDKTSMCSDIPIAAGTKEDESNQLDLWLQIRMQPEASVTDPTKTTTIFLPYFRSTLEVTTGGTTETT